MIGIRSPPWMNPIAASSRCAAGIADVAPVPVGDDVSAHAEVTEHGVQVDGDAERQVSVMASFVRHRSCGRYTTSHAHHRPPKRGGRSCLAASASTRADGRTALPSCGSNGPRRSHSSS